MRIESSNRSSRKKLASVAKIEYGKMEWHRMCVLSFADASKRTYFPIIFLLFGDASLN